MAWKKDGKKSPLAQPTAKVLPKSRRGRPPAGTVAAKARFDRPKKGGYKTRQGTGGAKARELRTAALAVVRADTKVDVSGVMSHVRSTMNVRQYANQPPSRYNPCVGRAVCFLLATTDLGLEDILDRLRPEFADDDTALPAAITTLYEWRKADDEFDKLYRDARMAQSHYLVDCAMRYATQPYAGTITKTKTGGQWGEETTVTTSDNVARSRLIVEVIMRRAAQLNPDYRDKQEESDKPNEQLAALVAALKGNDDGNEDD